MEYEEIKKKKLNDDNLSFNLENNSKKTSKNFISFMPLPSQGGIRSSYRSQPKHSAKFEKNKSISILNFQNKIN